MLNFACYSKEVFLDCIGSQDTVSMSKGFEKYLAKRRTSKGLLDPKWSSMLKKLKAYKQENGHCNVPQSEGKLGMWVKDQRQAYNKGKLSKKRIDALEEIGFEWDAHEAAWRLQFEELKRFQEENGHCNVPQSEGKLGMWVKDQCQAYNKGKLSKERIDALEEIGFEWKLRKLG